MRQLLEKRLLLVTGKGGVGKTTAAAALALAGRACGKRVLLAEINEQVMPKVSPLAALFGREQLPSDPARIDPGGLRGTLIRNEEGTELFLASVLKVKAMAKVAVRLKALRGLMHAGPSFYEMGIYYHLLHLIRETRRGGEPEHELIVLDMPATGHTLALTGLPTLLLNIVKRGAMADALREGKTFIGDPTLSGAVVVTLGETLPVTEALELAEGLAGTDVPVAGYLVNRVPGVSFGDAEASAAEALLARAPEVQGAAELRRALRARKALARLESEAKAPIAVFQEGMLEGRDLAEHLAEVIVGRPIPDPGVIR